MDLNERAAAHAALGDRRRLLIVEHLGAGDRTVSELAEISAMSGNLLAHHLEILESAGLIERHVSEGDRRRKYVSLRWSGFPVPVSPAPLSRRIAFVCTHNSARSQFAAALWQEATGANAHSAGSQPAERVHPSAVRIAAEFGIDLSAATTSGYDDLPADTDLIISVCDRANESEVPASRQRLHWSVPDPVPVNTLQAFRSAFSDIAGRVEHLTAET